MKKNLKIIVFAGILAIIFPACLENYLDKTPEAGLSTDVVFSKYKNALSFFDAAYDGRTGTGGFMMNIQCAHPFWQAYYLTALEQHTDMSDFAKAQIFAKLGSTNGATPNNILYAMFQVIRICNITLTNINMLQDAQEVDINDLIGQAHFIRAYAHFTVFRLWGPMPYITKVFAGTDEFDIPRLTRYENCIKVAQDFDTAYVYFRKAGIMRRDADLQLSSPNQFRPAGAAALGMKARVLLYLASPQNNKNGITDWQDAAKACWTAIDTASFYGYAMQTAANAGGDLGQAYRNNFLNVPRTNEQLWSYYYNQNNPAVAANAVNFSTMQSLINGVFAGIKTRNSGENPTQNFMDRYETIWGDPLNTEADRTAASLIGHYKEQDPYSNRDPRMKWDVIYNQSMEVPGYSPANIYYQTVNGKQVFAELLDQTYLGITHTGYYVRKIICDRNSKVTTSWNLTDPLLRVAELYLNYAEAAAQAYGGANGIAPGASLTAIQAVNLVRNRVGMPGLPAGLNPDAFMARLKNERTVELCFEGHYFYDIRRWLDAPVTMGQVLYGMDIEKVTVSSTYPKGFRYTRVPLPASRQCTWNDVMYVWPFSQTDMNKMHNFIPNPVW